MSDSSVASWTPAQLASRSLAVAADSALIARRVALAQAARQFHMAQGLLTKDVEAALSSLKAGAGLVRLAHQPNFLPDANLFAQILYLNQLRDAVAAAGTHVVSVVLLVDHDVAGNERFGRSEVWDPRVPGHVRRFQLPVGETEKRCVMAVLRQPDLSYRQVLLHNVIAYAAALTDHAQRQGRPKNEFETSAADVSELLGLEHDFESLSAFTSYPLMRVALLEWGLPIVFCPITALSVQLAPVYETIIRRLAQSEALGPEALCWYVCGTCGLRRASDNTTPEPCPACGTQASSTGALREAEWHDHRGRLVPRVLVDDLADYLGLGIAAGTSYLGGRAHLRRSHDVALHASLPVAPEASWRVSILYDGPMERLAGALYANLTAVPPSLTRASVVLAEGRQGFAYYLCQPGLRGRLPKAVRAVFEGSTMGDDTRVLVSEGSNAEFQKLEAALAAHGRSREGVAPRVA